VLNWANNCHFIAGFPVPDMQFLSSVIHRSFIVHPVIISQKLGKIDPYLL